MASKIIPLPSTPAAPTRLNGHTDEQLWKILNEIGTTANVLRDAGMFDPETAERNHHVNRWLAERIGLLADLAGANCIGGVADWMLADFATDDTKKD